MSQDHLADQDQATEADLSVLRVRVSLKGRPVRSHSFTKDVVTFGRDPEADVFLDNPGISREHLKIVRNGDDFWAEDLESANGTFLNDQALRREKLSNEDVLRVGKFSLWVSIENDRRHQSSPRPASEASYQGTTVLSTTELDKLMTKIRTTEETPPPPVLTESTEGAPHAGTDRLPHAWVAALVGAFVLGAIAGGLMVGILMR